MSEFASESPVYHELAMIAYYCGYQQTPSLDAIYNIMQKCISIGRIGWGLALFALNLALSGGSIPFYAVMPIPFAHLARLKELYVVHELVLVREQIAQHEGFFTVTSTRIAGGRKLDYPTVFGVVLVYEDESGNENVRCFLVKRTNLNNYPFMATIPSDETCRKMLRLCRENRHVMSEEEIERYIREHGVQIEEREQRPEKPRGGENIVEEEIVVDIEGSPEGGL